MRSLKMMFVNVAIMVLKEGIQCLYIDSINSDINLNRRSYMIAPLVADIEDLT